MKRAHLQTPPPAQVRTLGVWYSGALNRWGVTLQRNERLAEATSCFALALELNPDNLAARVNLQCNSNLLAGVPLTLARTDALQEQLGKYRNLGQVLVENGPFDDPSYCYHLGLGFAGAQFFRQAIQQFERVAALVPKDLPVRLQVGDWYNRIGRVGRALQIAAEIRGDPSLRPLDTATEVEAALLEARAYLSLTNRLMAQAVINALLFAHPGDAAIADRAASTLASYGDFPAALKIVDRLLESNPDDPAALAKKGNIYLIKGDFSNAIPLLTRSLSVTNSYTARLTRAFAYLQSTNLDSAEADYRELLQSFPAAPHAYYGLGEVAWQRGDTNTAIRHYEDFLSRGGADSAEARAAAAKLQALRPPRR
jgi:tetratricopeptide (TPR) repeat protein